MSIQTIKIFFLFYNLKMSNKISILIFIVYKFILHFTFHRTYHSHDGLKSLNTIQKVQKYSE